MSSETPEPVFIKRRHRPNAPSRARTNSPAVESQGTPAPDGNEASTGNAINREDLNDSGTPVPGSSESDNEDTNLPLDELLELRRLRRARQGIDVGKLNTGGPRKKKVKDEGADGSTTTPEGLIKKPVKQEVDEEGPRGEESKARRVVRTNNFTQQTNALDVDKHMMAYIEENIKKRRGADEETEEGSIPKGFDAQDELFNLSEKLRTQSAKPVEEGNVTNSLAMLTAIPEVDLGMDSRLKNIEETEKAKQILAETRRERRNADEEHLVATRFFRPNKKQKSDADFIREAKREAMGFRPDNNDGEQRRQYQDRNQTATDEMVMERFKKRMRR